MEWAESNGNGKHGLKEHAIEYGFDKEQAMEFQRMFESVGLKEVFRLSSYKLLSKPAEKKKKKMTVVARVEFDKTRIMLSNNICLSLNHQIRINT